MNSIHDCQKEHPPQRPEGQGLPLLDNELDWLERGSSLACWIGIAGLILLIARGTWAANTGTQSSFPSGSRSFNPMGSTPGSAGPNTNSAESTTGGMQGPRGQNVPHPHAPNNSFFDDEDDEDFDGFEDPSDHFPPPGKAGPSAFPPAGSTYSPAPRSLSTGLPGNRGNNAPDPIMTDQGIAVGGSPTNGVISKNKIPPVKIDDETAEGSKDVVTDFNFPDADILDIAKTLGKLTGKNFIFDKDVKGRITIVSNSPITVGEAWKVFLTALDINGFAMIPSGKYLRIARQRDARDKQLKTYTGEYSPDTDALITRVFQLKYISAEEVARTFRSFMPANARVIPYEQTNAVIVTDTGSNISRLAKMLELLDVEGYDAGIEVIPVKYASAAELSKLIDTLIPGTATPTPGQPPGGAPRFGGGSGGRFTARRTKEGGIINTIISDDRTNTLIVHANSKGADQVRELVAKLDLNKPTATGGGKVHVIYLQFADAEQISNTLNNFSQGNGSRPPTNPPGAGGGTGINPVEASLFQGAIKISPDKATNALVITANPSDYVTVKRVIDKLDIPRDQVYIETVIMEVQIGRSFNYSANIVTANPILGTLTNSSDLFNLLANPANVGNGILLPLAAGGPANITVNGTQVPANNINGLIKAIQGHTTANVLATPQIIALDNAEANFESAEKIPVLTSTSVQGAGVSQSVQKEPVAISIKIKPQINKVTNFVKLDVETKLGTISNRNLPSAVQNLAYATQDRTAKTTVVVGDSDTVVLGGLTREDVQETINKVPVLGDIPLLGWLFKSKVSSTTKNNLLIFMTPHIIRPYEKIRAILDRKLKERDDFIETTAGGDDSVRAQRDAIIRSLPDIKDITTKKPPTAANAAMLEDEKPSVVPLGSNGNFIYNSPNNQSTPNDTAPTNPAPLGPQPPTFNPEDRAPVAVPPPASIPPPPTTDLPAQPVPPATGPSGDSAPTGAPNL